jgi:putative zinc finger/helix-turn-helix YgiT family protein
MAKRNKDTIVLKQCPDCGRGGDGALKRQRITHRWIEGVEEEREFEAEIDAVCCSKCGTQVMDEYARLQKHEAWCRATGMLGPRQIRRIRRRLNLTIEQFAKLLGTGSASVGRWERGATVQNVGNDNLMRLLSKRSNVVALARRAGIVTPESAVTRLISADGDPGTWQPRFPSLQITPELQARARRFRPRRGVA